MNRLAELRKAHGLTQKALARELGMAVFNVAAIECGVRKPWPNFKRKVSRVLEVPEEEIFGVETQAI